MALSVVIFTQIIQLCTTIFLIILSSIVTKSYVDFTISAFWIYIILCVIFLPLIMVVIYRPLYRWVSLKIVYYYHQIKPLFVYLLHTPSKLFVGWFGTIIMTMGYASCFYFTLYAFTDQFSFPLICLAFITANHVGSSVPSPGGIGGVELALSGALRLIGVTSSIAVSTAVLYRVICFWIRIPIGWIAWNYCKRKGLL